MGSILKWLIGSIAGKWVMGLMVVALLAGVWKVHSIIWHKGEAAGKAEIQALFDAYKDEVAKERAASEALARAQEAQQAATIRIIEISHEDNRRAIQKRYDRDIADLRAGHLKLRQHWQGCGSGELSTATPGSSIPDVTTLLRERSAARIVQLGAECDAQVTGLQAVVRAVTKAELTQ